MESFTRIQPASTVGVVLSAGHLTQLVREATRSQHEANWIEYKHNNADPDQIAENVSALANGAALAGRPHGFVIWGIDDKTRTPVGTTFDPRTTRVGAELLEGWLARTLSPSPHLRFEWVELEGKQLVVLTIDCASHTPVQFKGVDYIRVGSYTKKLRDFPEYERQLWRTFDATPFESQLQHVGISAGEVRRLLSVEAYFDLLKVPALVQEGEILAALERDRMIARSASSGWDVTNLGALCLAKKIDEFPALQRKAVRFVQYSEPTKTAAIDAKDGKLGYVVGFEGLLGFIQGKLPKREVTDPIRRTVESFPSIAVRELIANALVHQDLSVQGAGPLVELYPDRLEISNPGRPLMETDRLLDTAPRSRNEALAGFMRRAGICEERGSGVDKAALAAEIDQLPAPIFRADPGSTIATVLGPRTLIQLDKSQKLWATYLHTALRFVAHQEVTNSTLRTRFGIHEKNSSTASRLLTEAMEAGLIRPKDPTVGHRAKSYVPYWA